MVMDLQHHNPAPVDQTDNKIRKLAHRDQLVDVISVEQQVLGREFSWIKKRLGDHLELPGYLSVYVIYIHEKPVSTGWIYFHTHNPFATLNGGATIPEYHQSGLYTALINMRFREAQERDITLSPLMPTLSAAQSLNRMAFICSPSPTRCSGVDK